MSLAKKFTAITTDGYLKKIVEKKLSPEEIFDNFKTTKTSYRAAILDILKTNNINKLPLGQFKILVESISKLTDVAQNANLLSLNTKSKLYGEIRALVKEDRRTHLKDFIRLTKAESNLRAEKQQINVKRDNVQQTNIEDKTIETMIRNLMAIERKSLTQKIILAQVSLGTRLIEILNKNVSKFKIDPDNTNNIIQSGVAKAKGDGTRTVDKPTILITPSEFMQLIKEIRQVTDADSTKKTNIEITNKYNARVNTEIKKIFLKNKIPDKLKSSHSLRKIWVNYSFKHNAPRGTSLVSWISSKLGHDEKFLSQSANHYSTINVETASVLTENQGNSVNEAKRRSIENRDDINEIKKAMKDISKPKQVFVPVQSIKGQNNRMTLNEKFEFIEKLIKMGYTSYSQFQTKGISTYVLSKYKKYKNITGPL